MRYWIFVVFPSSLNSSFSITIGFPVAFARAHAMALHSGQPIVSCVFVSFLVSWHISLNMWFVISTVIMLFSVLTSAFSAISISSMSSFGRLFCM